METGRCMRKSLRSWCAYAVDRYLAGENLPDSTEWACGFIQDGLMADGLLPGESPDIRKAFMEELCLRFLAYANALYGYPYTDAELDGSVLPVWLLLLARLERPCAFRDAFLVHFAEQGRFPLPGQIMARLPASALPSGKASHDAEEEAGSGCGPGYARRMCEEIRDKCRVIRFQSLKRQNQCPLPVARASGGEE